MPVKRHQQSGAENFENEACASLHNPPPTNLIFAEFPCSLTKICHGFNTNKTKNILVATVTGNEPWFY